MNITKMIGMILLAVYLILMGLATMSELRMGGMASNILQLVGVASGVLILVSIGKFTRRK